MLYKMIEKCRDIFVGRNMKNKYKIILLILTLLASNSFSALAREDINWEDYEDFAMNNGKYIAGRENIYVYKKNGEISGIIDVAMPSFHGVIDLGNAALWNDNQVLVTVAHINHSNVTMNNRYFRNDVKLFTKSENQNMTSMFSENYKVAYSQTTPNGNDTRISRLTSIVFDEKKQEAIKSSEESKLNKKDVLVARIGGGTNNIATDRGEIGGAPYGFIAGGLNKIIRNFTQQGIKYVVAIDKEPKTAIDVGSRGGDSGSPAFYYDSQDKKWKFFASNSGGIGDGYGKTSYLTTEIKWYEDKMKEFDDEKINSGSINIKSIGAGKGELSFDNMTREFYSSNDNKAKNQIFFKNSTITVENDVDTKIARYTFEEDSTISGNGTLQTAGFDIKEGKTVKYLLKLKNDNVIRKIGKGTLEINSNSSNAELNVGDGLVLLKSNNGPAFSKIRIATGEATVKIDGENQINGDNVYFGRNGGKLDLNGKNLTFNNIYHIDSGANISNSNSSEKSKFILENTDNITYLGSFTGNLDVEYKGNKDSSLELRGNTDIQGTFSAENTNVILIGDNVLHGYKLKIGEDEYISSSFKSSEFSLKNSNLILNRASTIDSKIVLDNTNLSILGNGKVLTERKQNYKDEDVLKVEEETNKINIKGNLEFKNNDSNTFNVDLKNNNIADISANISGNINLVKKGTGTLYINGKNNITGKIEVEEGDVRLNNLESVGSVKIKSFKETSLVEIENEDKSLDEILEKIEKDSKGTLSLKNDFSLTNKINEYENIYLTSSKDISIGKTNEKIDSSITTLNIGGDNGTVTLKGIDLSSSLMNINIGNSHRKGKVIIEKLGSQNTKLDIVVNKLMELEIKDYSDFNKRVIDLNYGSSADVKLKNLIKNNASGILFVKENDSLKDIDLKDISIGVRKNDKLNITELNDVSEYKFSSAGELNLNFNFENNDLIIDSQYLSGGVVNISNSNENYSGNISIIANKTNDNIGDVKVVLEKDYTLGKKNDINLNRAILDLNGKKSSFGNIVDDENSNIVSNEKTKLDFNLSNNTEIKSKLSGNIDLTFNIENGASVELKNINNSFKGDVTVNGGEYIHKESNVMDKYSKLNINDGKITIYNDLESELNVSSDNENSIDLRNLEKGIKIYSLNAKTNLVSNGKLENKEKNRIIYENIDFNNNLIKFSNQFFSINNTKKDTKGSIEIENSTFKISGVSNSLLTKERFNEINIKDSIIDLENYQFNEKYNSQDINLSGNILIRDNSINKVKFNNNLIFKDETKLNIIANNSTEIFSFDANISGKGNIDILTGNNGLEIKNNFKDFDGTLNLKGNSKISYTIIKSEDNIKAADKEYNNIKYKIKSETENSLIEAITKGSLIFNDLKEYKGKLVASIAEIVLNGEKAINTRAKLYTQSGAINLKTDNYVETSSLNIDVSTKEYYTNQYLKKTGLGEVVLKDGISLKNSDGIYVEEGTLTLNLSKDLNVYRTIFDNNLKLKDYYTYWINENSNIKFSNLEDIRTNALITGKGNLIIDNKDKVFGIDVDRLQHSGNTNINSGTLEIYLDKNKKLSENEEKEIFEKILGSGTLKLTTEDSDNYVVSINENLNFDGTYELNKTNLDFNLKEIYRVNNKIKGNGNITNISSNLLELTNLKDFTGNVIAQNSDIKLTDEAIESKGNFYGENSLIFNTETTDKYNSFKNVFVKDIIKQGEYKLSVDSDILNNGYNVKILEGTLKINDTNTLEKSSSFSKFNILSSLEIENKDYKFIENEIKGTGNIKIIGGITEFKDLESFSGNITSDNTIKLVDSNINVLSPTIKSKNLNFDINNDIEFNSEKVLADKLIKSGKAKLIMENNFKDIDNLSGEIEIKNNTKLNTLNNNAILDIQNNKIEINEYSGDGIVKLDLLGENEYRIISKNSFNNINLELDEINYDILKTSDINLADYSSNVIVTNLDKINSEKLLDLSLINKNNLYSIGIAPKIEYLSLVNLLKEIYDVNNYTDNTTYLDNAINSNLIFSYKKENEYRKYLTLKNVNYLNETMVYGVNLSYSKNLKFDKFNLLGSVSSQFVDINTKTRVKENDTEYINHILNTSLNLKLQGTYKYIYGSFKLGINTAVFLNKDNNKYLSLNNEYLFGVSPIFNVANIGIKYINELELKYQPKLYDSLKDETVKEINLKTPIIYSYRTGIEIISDKIEFNISTKLGYNQTNIEIKSKYDDLTNDRINRLYIEGDMNIKYKATDSINVNFNTGINNESNTIKLKLGIDYKF